jgi:hypothetical protein
LPGAELLAEDSDQRDEASRWAVALSDPNYYTAFRSVFRNPTFGSQFWNPQERDAMARVNRLHMRSGPLGTASMGFALPLVLDPDIKLINAGQSNPWRELSTIKLTTSNTYNSVTSSGATAAWLGEGVVSSDNTPVLGQLQIPVYKMASWLFGSYESVGWESNGNDADVAFASQISGLLADALRRVVEGFDTDDGPHQLLHVGSGEGAAQQVAGELVADRGHDHALVKGEVEGRHDTGLNVDRVAEAPLGVDAEVTAQVGKVGQHRGAIPA